MSKKTDRFVNRELSWLEFNQRVLDEARDPAVPVLERLKFLAITSSNLDEFFKVRVGGLHLLAKENSTKTDPSGMTACAVKSGASFCTKTLIAEQPFGVRAFGAREKLKAGAGDRLATVAAGGPVQRGPDLSKFYRLAPQQSKPLKRLQPSS